SGGTGSSPTARRGSSDARTPSRSSADVTTELVVLAAFAGIMAGVVLSILSIVRLVRLASQPELARAPIAPQSTVTFAQAGRVELALEGPLFTSKLRSLGFELLDPAGLPVRLDRLWMRTSS